MRKPRRNKPPPPAAQPKPTDLALPTQEEILERSIMVAASSKVWRAPLPEPSDYAEYGRIEPTAPERILRQWERESDHRREYEIKGLEGFNRRGEIGLRNALIFALSALATSVVAIVFHEPWVAGTIGGGTIVAGIGAFVYQRRAGGSSPSGGEETKPKIEKKQF